MTKWNEAPLRPQGQPWPGLNTRGGKLDPGMGYLQDGSINVIVNSADTLAKRQGFIRGIEERFDTVVCGLFKYTDDCANEYLVVADAEGVKVRAPFDIPTFLGSDTFPIDNFVTLDTNRWANTDDYKVEQQSLFLNQFASFSTSQFVEESRFMQWFKEASLSSYQIEIEYSTAAGEPTQVVSAVIKRNGDTFLQASVYLNGESYSASIHLVLNGVRTTLQQIDLTGNQFGDGFLRLQYDAIEFTVEARVVTVGGGVFTLSKQITEAQNNALGQNSAIGISYSEILPVSIQSVTGGAI
jgi:hypothetical protein